MYAADLESKEFNKIKPAEKQEEIINRIEDKLVLHSTQEARLIIAELAAIVKETKKQCILMKKKYRNLITSLWKLKTELKGLMKQLKQSLISGNITKDS